MGSQEINLTKDVFLCLIILFYQLSSAQPLTVVTFKPIPKLQTDAEAKVQLGEGLRQIRQETISRENDMQKINGGGTTKEILYDPYTKLQDSKGRPQIDWLSSYGGQPLGFEVIFVALIPVILAKLLRIFRNFFRPNLKLKRNTADFPIVPLIYLQQTKLESRVRREKRNGIDWLGKKFLIRASDNIVDSLRIFQGQAYEKHAGANPWVLLKIMTQFTAALHHAKDKTDHDHVPGLVYRHPTHETELEGTESADGLKDSKTVTILSPHKTGPELPESTTGLSSEETTDTEDNKAQKDLKVSFSLGKPSKEISLLEPIIEPENEDEDGEYEDEDDEDLEEEEDAENDTDAEGVDDAKKDAVDFKNAKARKAPKRGSMKTKKKDAKKIQKDVTGKMSFQLISEKPKGGAAIRQKKDKKAPRSKPPAWEKAPEIGSLEPELPSSLNQLQSFSLVKKENKKRDSKKRGKEQDPENPSSPDSDDK